MTRFEFYKAIVTSSTLSNSTDPTDVAALAYATEQYDKQVQEMADRAEERILKEKQKQKKISRDEQRRADAKAGQEAVRSMIERYEANSVGGVMVKKMIERYEANADLSR